MTDTPSRWPVLSGLDTTSFTTTASPLLRLSGAGNHPTAGTQATLNLIDCSARAVGFRRCEQYPVSLEPARDMKYMVSFSCSTVLSTWCDPPSSPLSSLFSTRGSLRPILLELGLGRGWHTPFAFGVANLSAPHPAALDVVLLFVSGTVVSGLRLVLGPDSIFPL